MMGVPESDMQKNLILLGVVFLAVFLTIKGFHHLLTGRKSD